MRRKDFYVILGVSRGESGKGIRQAFHDLALRYHPDRAGSQGTRFFQDIVEAYETLSDPERRRSYDRGLTHAGDVGPSPPPTTRVSPQAEPLVSSAPSSSAAEPLIPPSSVAGARESRLPYRLPLMRGFEVTRPSAEEVFDRLLGNFLGRRVPQSPHLLDALRLELRLSREEAIQGGTIDLEVPVFFPCPRCQGQGHDWGFPCRACQGKGMVEEERPVRLRIPPGVRDGATFDISLRGLGIHNLYLHLLIRVTP